MELSETIRIQWGFDTLWSTCVRQCTLINPMGFSNLMQHDATISWNSTLDGLAAHLNSHPAQRLSSNPQYCGFAPHARGWGLHLDWHGFEPVELQTHKIIALMLDSSNLFARWHGPQPTICRVCCSICAFRKKSSVPLTTDVQAAEGSVVQIREFGKVVRATNEHPKFRKLRIWPYFLANMFFGGHDSDPTIYRVWKLWTCETQDFDNFVETIGLYEQELQTLIIMNLLLH